MDDFDPSVPMRDYVDARICSIDKATDVYREDVNRRLEALNQLRKEVLEDRQQFVNQAVYNTSEGERSKWRELVSQRLTVVETRSVTWTSALGLFFTVIQVLMWVAYYFIGHH